MRGGKARDLRACDTGLRVDQRFAARQNLRVHQLQRAMHENNRAAQTAVADQEIAAEPDHMHRLICGNGAHETREIFEVAGKVRAIRRAACAPAGVFAHRLVQAKLAAEPALGNTFQFSHVHASYTCPFCLRPASAPGTAPIEPAPIVTTTSPERARSRIACGSSLTCSMKTGSTLPATRIARASALPSAATMGASPAG